MQQGQLKKVNTAQLYQNIFFLNCVLVYLQTALKCF